MVDWVLRCTGKLEVGILLWSRFPALCRWLWRICISSAVLGWMWYIFHISSLTHEDKHRCTLDFVCCAGRINLRCTPELQKNGRSFIDLGAVRCRFCYLVRSVRRNSPVLCFRAVRIGPRCNVGRYGRSGSRNNSRIFDFKLDQAMGHVVPSGSFTIDQGKES